MFRGVPYVSFGVSLVQKNVVQICWLSPVPAFNYRMKIINGDLRVTCMPVHVKIPIRNAIDVAWYLGNLKFDLYGFSLTPTQYSSHK